MALVVLIFLQSWRASLVPLLAIPVSLVGTFAVMAIFGFSLNNLSLFGLVLAIGIVVDDAIVVVENVDRWIEHGLSPRDAAYRAMQEVTPAVIAIAFGLTAVSFRSPLSAESRPVLPPVRPDHFILHTAVGVQLAYAQPGAGGADPQTAHGGKGLADAYHRPGAGLVLSAVQSRPGEAERRLRGDLKYVVRLSVLVLAVYVGLLVLTYFGFKTVPLGFIPQQDQGYLIAAVQLPDASSIDRTDAVVERLSAIAKKIPGIQATFGVTGFNLLTGTNQTNAGTIFFPLDKFR